MAAADTFLSETQKAQVEETIAEVEQNTTAEIVVAVASSSGRYDRAEDLFGLLLGMVSLLVTLLYCQNEFSSLGRTTADWSTFTPELLSILLPLFALLLGFVLGATLASYLPGLALIFVPKSQLAEEVERSAHEIFSREQVRSTVGASGILIFISLREHLVRVLPDTGIAEKVAQKEWEEICARIIDGIKQNQAAEGLQEAVRLSGALLAEHFPQAEGVDVDELKNHVRIYS